MRAFGPLARRFVRQRLVRTERAPQTRKAVRSAHEEAAQARVIRHRRLKAPETVERDRKQVDQLRGRRAFVPADAALAVIETRGEGWVCAATLPKRATTCIPGGWLASRAVSSPEKEIRRAPHSLARVPRDGASVWPSRAERCPRLGKTAKLRRQAPPQARHPLRPR